MTSAAFDDCRMSIAAVAPERARDRDQVWPVRADSWRDERGFGVCE